MTAVARRHPATAAELAPAPPPARLLHPLAWWAWAGCLAAGASRTTNPLLLGLTVAVAAYVVAARRPDAPWARSFGTMLRLGLLVIVVRVVLQILVGQRLPGTVVLDLPEVSLPDWAAGVSLGGPVTVEALFGAATQGLQLATLLACFGAANSLCSPFRLLRSLPAILYEAGVAVTVALSFAPQLVVSAGQVREARRLRGRPTRGLAALRGIAVPVLTGALDRAVALAASMDARGYGRHPEGSPRRRRATQAATGVGLLAIMIGLYGMLDTSAPGALGLPAVALGAGLLAATLFDVGRRSGRTRYRPDRWRMPESVVALSGVVALAGMVAVGRLDPTALVMPLAPLAPPALPPLAVAGLAVALLPARVAPPPPGLGLRPLAPGGADRPSRPGSP